MSIRHGAGPARGRVVCLGVAFLGAVLGGCEVRRRTPLVAPNQAPSVSAGADQVVDEQMDVVLEGSASDSDGTVQAYRWRQVWGPPVELEAGDRPVARFVAPTSTRVVELGFQLTATDDQGATATDSTRVSVLPVNAAPRVDAGEPKEVPEQTTVELVASAEDGDGTIRAYTWLQVAGAEVELESPRTARTTFRSPMTSFPVELAFSVTVEDNESAVASDTAYVLVQPVNESPAVTPGPDQVVREASAVRLSVQATDADGTIVSVTWEQTEGPAVALDVRDSSAPVFVAPGTVVPVHLSFRVAATDNEGGVTEAVVRVEVRPSVGGGFRYSIFSPAAYAGPDYWATVGARMAAGIPFAHPHAKWVVATLFSGGPMLSFPGRSNDPRIAFDTVDRNEATLTHFDEIGVEVWLSVEPGDASVAELMRLVLERYAHHPSVVGVGVDIEWLGRAWAPVGRPVTDAEASAWLELIRDFDPADRLFLTHWRTDRMPPSVRDGIVFVDDGQRFSSLDRLLDSFEAWGEWFAPARVAYIYGFEADRWIWARLGDPPLDLARAIVGRVSNVAGLYWMDSTILEVFPQGN